MPHILQFSKSQLELVLQCHLPVDPSAETHPPNTYPFPEPASFWHVSPSAWNEYMTDPVVAALAAGEESSTAVPFIERASSWCWAIISSCGEMTGGRKALALAAAAVEAITTGNFIGRLFEFKVIICS